MRRVSGESMSPALRAGDIIIAYATRRRLRLGDIVIVQHNGLEKIKRLQGMKNAQVFLIGDNPAHSTDSRSFGWLDQEAVIGKVIWPRR